MKYFFLFLILPAFCFAQKGHRENYIYYNLGSGYSNFGTPFYLNLEIGPMYTKLTQRLSFGVDFSYRHFQEPFNSTFYKHKIVGMMPNMNLHILKSVSRSDLYFGNGVGLFHMSPAPKDTIAYPSTFINFDVQIGFRYFFSNTVGCNVEFKECVLSSFSHKFLYEARVGVTIKLAPKK